MTSAPSDFQLIHFDLDHIIKFGKTQSKPLEDKSIANVKKRKFTPRSNLSIDNLKYSDVSISQSVSETEEETVAENIIVVDRTIHFFDRAPVSLAGVEEIDSGPGLSELVTDDIKLSYDNSDGLLIIKSKKVGIVTPKTLLSINIFGLDIQKREVLKNELAMINMAGLKLRKNGLLVVPPILRLKLSTSTDTVEVSLQYKIFNQCDIYKVCQPDLFQRFNSVVNDLITYAPTSWEVSEEERLRRIPVLDTTVPNDPVSAKLFYTSISENTAQLPKINENFDIPELETNLLGFQRKTLRWLLEKEHVKYNNETNRCERLSLITQEFKTDLEEYLVGSSLDLEVLDSSLVKSLNDLCFGWKRVRMNGELYFHNSYTSNIVTRKEVCKYFLDYFSNPDKQNFPLYLPAQGLLAEEMGLGKTVEVTTLILMNQRPTNEINEPIKIQLQSFGDFKTIIKSKTTLVIAPDSILKQWVEEIIHLVPSLAVTIYNGVGKYPKLQNNPFLIAEYLRKFDVVFTTYSTISKELDYALYSSRNKSTRVRRAKSAEKHSTYDETIYGEPDYFGRQTRSAPDDPTENDLDGSETTPPIDTSYDTTNDALLNDYQSLFQIAVKSAKPKIANLKSSDSQDGTDYEQALQDEINLAIRHNKVPAIYKCVDYESPLMLTQFWRVILDEVQMVSSKISRAFQSASLIPRLHSWGVSGTPIKKNLQDLHSILQFLKVRPFCNDIGKTSWELLISGSNEKPADDPIKSLKRSTTADFIRLWTSISIRHTKAMTHDDIKLPPQHRILLSIPFSPIEQDLYNQLLEECLATICLDVNGNPISNDWEPSTTILTYMRTWLSKLRQVCCNPQIGKLNIGSKKYRKSYTNARGIGIIQKLKTLENLLDDMLTKAYNEVIDVERQLYQLYLDLGEFHEFVYQPDTSLIFLVLGSKKTERISYRLKLILAKFIENYKIYHRKISGDEKVKIENDDEIGNIESAGSVNSEDDVLEKLEEKIRLLRIRIRNWNIMLHRFYFLIASAYFQKYDEEFQGIIQEFAPKDFELILPDELTQLQTFEDDDLKDELASLVNDVPIEGFRFNQIDHTENIKLEDYAIEAASEEEGKFKYLELKYYELAEQTRRDILSNSIANVEKSVKSRILSRGYFHDSLKSFEDDGQLQLPKNSRSFFKIIPQIKVEKIEEYVIMMDIKIFVDGLDKSIQQLNNQTVIINEWMSDMVTILCKPLLSHDKNPNGEEYEESIKDQDKVSSYLFVLGQMLNDRFEVLNGLESSVKLVTIKKVQEQRDAEIELQKVNDTEFLSNLQVIRENAKPRVKKSFQELVLHIKTLETDLKDDIDSELSEKDRFSVQLELLAELGNKMRIIYENQKLALTLIQKELNLSCNHVFNSRTDYFKQLQQISDSVKTSDFGMERQKLEGTAVQKKLINFGQRSKGIKGKMDKSIAKFRYLRGLVKSSLGEENESDSGRYGDEELMCSICRCTITIGSLTQCGHKYCKDCLEQWLKTVRNCPMCKSSISMDSVYNFTHHKPDLKANKVEEEQLGQDNLAKNLHSIYKPLTKDVIDEIEQIKLKNSYSSKVDLIVKQVLYLRSRDPKVQIVVFSQWQDMLYILGTAFKASDISYLGSYGTLTPEVGLGRKPKKFDSVEYFKDPKNEVTCFLLNAKAQSSGLTLINATHIFLCEPLVNTSLELQAISRIHRIGQTKPTTVWMFVIENTVEESIVLTSTNKRLQYMEGEGDGTPSVESNAERSLSKAESITLMNSEGIDTLINKGSSRGESVTNSDLWNAFFSARSRPAIQASATAEK